MRQPKCTIVHYNQLWARKAIPVDLRQALGKNQFLEKIGDWPAEYTQANAAVSLLIARWTYQIRQTRQGHVQDTFRRVIDPEVQPIKGTVVDWMITSEGYRKENEALTAAKASDKKQNITLGFLDHFEEWKSRTHLKKKTLDQAISEIKKFDDQVKPGSLGSLTGRRVQTWIEDQLQTASAGTVRRKLSILKSYWSWLESHELVARDASPFDNRRVKDPRTAVERTLDKRQPFKPDDIPRLIEASVHDLPLQNLIKIAAYTGARREGVASLKVKSVIIKDGVRCLDLQEKTDAGVRQVPIHSEISGLIDQLIKESKDGYLIPSITAKNGDRGNYIGRRFTPLKRKLGFAKYHVFHSIRHTVVDLFRFAGCPLEIRNQILGHEDGDEVLGAGAGYGVGISTQQKLDWLERAVRY